MPLRLSLGCPDCIWWLTGFPNIPSRNARSRFSPCRPRSGISCAECRHGFSLPSAVTRDAVAVGAEAVAHRANQTDFPLQPGIRYRSATPSIRHALSFGRACSTASAEGSRSRGQSAHSPIGMSSMKHYLIFPSCASAASAGISSAFTPPSNTAFSFVPRIRRSAASSPASISAKRTAARDAAELYPHLVYPD